MRRLSWGHRRWGRRCGVALALSGLLLTLPLAQAQSSPAQSGPTPSSAGTAASRPLQRPEPGGIPEVQLRGRELQGTQRGEVVWSQTFPPELGTLRGPLRQGEITYLGAGPVVLAYSAQGEVLARYDLSAPVLTLDGSGGLIRATVSGGEYRETFTLNPPDSGGGTQERVVFAPDPAITLWTMQAADLVPAEQILSRWQQDGLNPFLGLRAAQQARAAGDTPQEQDALQRLMTGSQPFPVWVKLAARLDAAGYPEQADQALELARADAARRGYDPAIRVSRDALTAYGHPSGYINSLLEQGRLNRAEVWLRHLRVMHPRIEGGQELYSRYAELLESQNRAGEASEWRRFADSLRDQTLYHQGARGLTQLRDVGGLLALALALSWLLTVWAIARHARDRQEAAALEHLGRSPARRLGHHSLRYAGVGERLVLLGFSAALVLSLSGGLWASRTAALLETPALNTGTYGGAWAETGLAKLYLGSNPDAALLRGLTTQLSGDLSAARVRYQAAPDLACARNNLGTIAALRDDRPTAEALFRSALSLQPDLGAAAYNLDFPTLSLGSQFQENYRPAEPRLCYPDDRSLIRALSGDITTIWQEQLRQPAEQLRAIAQAAQQGHLHPWALLWLAELLTVGTLLLLLLPQRRPPDRLTHFSGRRRPGDWAADRPARYPGRDPLAWLLPGSGLLEWVWGGPLLLTFVTAALAALAGWALSLQSAGLPLPWPLTLWPAAGWPGSLPLLESRWPLAVMAACLLVNALCLLRLWQQHRHTRP